MSGRTAILLVALTCLLPACGGGDEDGLRRAFGDLTAACVEKDYATAFSFVDREGRDAVAKQLRDFSNVRAGMPEYQAVRDLLRNTLDLAPEDLRGMDVQGWFVAMFEGMDRAEPELRRRQLEETRGRHIVAIGINDDRAVVKSEAPNGPPRTDIWRYEDGGWKITMDEVGTGIDRK